MVLHDPQVFGGLEEYATTLAIGVEELGHEVSVVSDTWIPAENQYRQRLEEKGIPFAQVPRWVSRPASHWPTKERLLDRGMRLVRPLVYLLAAGLWIAGRRPWRRSRASAGHWLQGLLLRTVVGPDRTASIGRMLLAWWNLRWRPDVLHIQGYTTGLLYVIEWAYKKRLPVVYEEHQTPDPQFDWWQRFSETINKSTVVVAVSHESGRALRDVCGVTRPIVVRNSLLPDPLRVSSQPVAPKRTRSRPIRVTTVARLYVTKGLTYLLEAIRRVRESHPDTQFRLYGEGPLREELHAYARQLGLDAEEILVGAFSDRDALSRIMDETDLFVMPSVLEGQPLAVVEAMAFGCPIVATTVGGIPELIADGVNGLLCAPKDPDCLARKICTLIDDPRLRQRLGRAARESYERSPFQPAAVSSHFPKQ